MAIIHGTSGDHALNGTLGDDTIYGYEESDAIHGGAGNDGIPAFMIYVNGLHNLTSAEFVI